jgi:hypothetical protein
VYNPPTPVQKEFSIVDKKGCTQFDPKIAGMFLDDFGVISTRQNLLQPCKMVGIA